MLYCCSSSFIKKITLGIDGSTEMESESYIFLGRQGYYKHDFILYQIFISSSIENKGL
jgi:hypothetical protein